MAAGPGAVVPAVLGTPPAAATNGTQRDEKKSASKTVTDTIIGGAQSVSAGKPPDVWLWIFLVFEGLNSYCKHFVEDLHKIGILFNRPVLIMQPILHIIATFLYLSLCPETTQLVFILCAGL